MKILLVDDNVHLMKATKRMIEAYNHEVVTAIDSSEALKILMHECDDVSVGMVITDYEINDGINGSELAHRIKALDKNMPVLLWSGDPNKIKNGDYADYVLSKTDNFNEILVIIDNISKRLLKNI